MRKALAILLVVSVAGCGSEKFKSSWQDRPVGDDGRIENWSDATKTVADGDLTVGVLNDFGRVYFYLRPESPRGAMSLYTSGFTIWLGEDEDRVGLRFPRADRGNAFDPDAVRGMMRDSAKMKIPAPMFDAVEVLDSEGTSIRRRFDDNLGLELIVVDGTDQPWMQLSIDLQPRMRDAVAVNAAPGDEIAMGLTTPEIDLRSMLGGGGMGPPSRGKGGPGGGQFPGGGPPGGGGRGFPGGGPRGGGGGPGGGRPSLPEPFDLSAKVALAKPPMDRPAG